MREKSGQFEGKIRLARLLGGRRRQHCWGVVHVLASLYPINMLFLFMVDVKESYEFMYINHEN